MFTLQDIAFRHSPEAAAVTLAAWTAAQGEHWALLGPSGSGKTTILHILAGLVSPATGVVVVAGQALRSLTGAGRDRWRGRTIGFVPQRLHLIPSLTVRDNVELPLALNGLPIDRRRTLALLGELGLGDRIGRRPDALSQGEAQRVAIARAVISRPALLLADEPTSSLDDANCARALDLLIDHAGRAGATLVIATHDRRVRSRLSNLQELQA